MAVREVCQGRGGETAEKGVEEVKVQEGGGGKDRRKEMGVGERSEMGGEGLTGWSECVSV